ncbi:MAG: hypothetical protein WCS56_02035 [Bacilli bacterium]
MLNTTRIITSNQCTNNEGGYHEIHEINFLNTKEHVLETVQSIIELNRKWTDSDCPLVDIQIECVNPKTVEFLEQNLHYDPMIKVYYALLMD